jgi:hypothetical protein
LQQGSAAALSKASTAGSYTGVAQILAALLAPA